MSVSPDPAVFGVLKSDRAEIVKAVKKHAERLLDHTPRFKFFTLHGKSHLDNLLDILDFLMNGGIKLSDDELFILCLAICIHDLGMIVPLREKEIREILDGRPGFPDAAALENYVRERHHELLDLYLENNLGFLASLGLSPNQIALVKDVSRCHRKVVLQEQTGLVKYLGALLRVIDELDIGSTRAPTDVFLNTWEEMDPTSCWHWFKHSITDAWGLDHTVNYINQNGRKRIVFTIVVRPTRRGSIEYWLRQIRRPISKALLDDGAQHIIHDKFGVTIETVIAAERSTVNNLTEVWRKIEEQALSANRKVILVVDDEKRKLEDLFLGLMDEFHVIFSPDARDAFTKFEAGTVNFAIIDMQVGAGGMWSAEETNHYKLTGIKLCEEIRSKYPDTKMGILTGTHHNVPSLDNLGLSFYLKKPVDPRDLLRHVQNAIN